jgi:hypothetical protein
MLVRADLGHFAPVAGSQEIQEEGYVIKKNMNY